MRIVPLLAIVAALMMTVQTIPRPEDADITDLLWTLKSVRGLSIYLSLQTDFSVKGYAPVAKWTWSTSRYVYLLDANNNIVMKFFLQFQDKFGKWHMQGVQSNVSPPIRVYLIQAI